VGASRQAVRGEELRFAGLTGELHLPGVGGPAPAVVALHPAGGPSRDHFLFLHLARVLPPRGVAVLRFDRRAGAADRFDEQSADALAAVATLAARPEIDAKRIGLWGFSQGAWVAPLAASRSRNVAFLILVAACGVTPAAQMRWGTSVQLRREGYAADVERMLAARRAWESFERGALARDSAQKIIGDVVREPWFPLAFVPPVLPPAPGRWPTMDFDPAPMLARVRVPVLAFYGDEDEWVPIDESIAALRGASIPDLTIVRLAGTKHHPTLGGGTDHPIAPEYERTLTAWLDDRTGARTYTRSR